MNTISSFTNRCSTAFCSVLPSAVVKAKDGSLTERYEHTWGPMIPLGVTSQLLPFIINPKSFKCLDQNSFNYSKETFGLFYTSIALFAIYGVVQKLRARNAIKESIIAEFVTNPFPSEKCFEKAAKNHHLIKEIIQRDKSSLSKKSPQGKTLLGMQNFCSYDESKEIVELLLKNGQWDSKEIYELLDNHMAFKYKFESVFTPALIKLLTPDHIKELLMKVPTIEALRALKAAGIDINIMGKDGLTPLQRIHFKIRSNEPDINNRFKSISRKGLRSKILAVAIGILGIAAASEGFRNLEMVRMKNQARDIIEKNGHIIGDSRFTIRDNSVEAWGVKLFNYYGDLEVKFKTDPSLSRYLENIAMFLYFPVTDQVSIETLHKKAKYTMALESIYEGGIKNGLFDGQGTFIECGDNLIREKGGRTTIPLRLYRYEGEFSSIAHKEDPNQRIEQIFTGQRFPVDDPAREFLPNYKPLDKNTLQPETGVFKRTAGIQWKTTFQPHSRDNPFIPS